MILNMKSGVIASGAVGSNKGIQSTKTGKQYCTFSIAAERIDKETVWANVKAWANLALVADGLQKGECVLVTGRLEEREYNGKQYKDIIADYIGKAPDAFARPVETGEAGEYQAPATGDTEDELPF